MMNIGNLGHKPNATSELKANTENEGLHPLLYGKSTAELVDLFKSKFSISSELSIKIDPIMDEYIVDKEFLSDVVFDDELTIWVRDNINKVLKGRVLNGFLYGKPGTGKSFRLKVLACAMGLPYADFPCSRNTTENELRTDFDLDANGQWKSFASLALKFHKYGGMLVLEEVNLADPGVIQGVFSQRLEAPFVATVNEERIERHPLCIVYGTANPGLAGTKDPNLATLSRLAFMRRLDDPVKETLIKEIIGDDTDKKHRQIAEWLLEMYNNIRTFIKNDGAIELVDAVTFRGLRQAYYDIIDGVGLTEEQIAFNDMCGSIDFSEPELAGRIYDDVIMKSDPLLVSNKTMSTDDCLEV